jgi:O-antigen ligase
MLPASGKYNNIEYQRMFEGIPVTTFMNANDFSSAMGVYFIYLYSYCKLQMNKSRFIFLFLSLFIIILANSRGVLLSALLAPLVFSLYNKKSVFKTIFLYIILLIMGLVFMHLFNVSGFYLDKYLNVFSSIKNGNRDSSSLYRLNIIVYTLKNLDQLLIGLGPNGSSVFLREFYIINPHNFFLEILIDYGFLGLTLVVAIFYNCFRLNIVISKSEVPEYLRSSCKAVNILFCLYIIISVVPSSFLNYWPFCWFPVYMTMMHDGIFNKLKKSDYKIIGECYRPA